MTLLTVPTSHDQTMQDSPAWEQRYISTGSRGSSSNLPSLITVSLNHCTKWIRYLWSTDSVHNHESSGSPRHPCYDVGGRVEPRHGTPVSHAVLLRVQLGSRKWPFKYLSLCCSLGRPKQSFPLAPGFGLTQHYGHLETESQNGRSCSFSFSYCLFHSL